jgi:acetyl esterase/lipase
MRQTVAASRLIRHEKIWALCHVGLAVNHSPARPIQVEISTGIPYHSRTMKLLIALACLSVVLTSAFAQANLSFALWPQGAPGAHGSEPKDVPTLTLFLPAAEQATGAAIVICPGGGYGHLAEHEGAHYARWLNELGIASFVLKYRLGSHDYRHPAMLQDAARAVRTVRARASEWQLDGNRIGIIGSSAGGHLASTLLTHFDSGNQDAADATERVSSRPDLGILCYPVITTGTFAHRGSIRNLLGNQPAPELLHDLSNELQVSSNTPPCFIWHTVADRTVPVENSLQFATALRAAAVPFALHVYERGDHGLGLGTREYNPANRHPWTRNCEFWLRERGFAK